MSERDFTVLHPPVLAVHEDGQATHDRLNKLGMEYLSVKDIAGRFKLSPERVQEEFGVDMKSRRAFYVMDHAKVAPDVVAEAVTIAGQPEHKARREAGLVERAQKREQDKVRETAADRVGMPEDKRPGAPTKVAEAREAGFVPLFVLKGQEGVFKEKAAAAGGQSRQDYMFDRGELQWIAKPDLAAKLSAEYGPAQKAAWEAQPEVKKLRERKAALQRDNGQTREAAGTKFYQSFDTPNPIYRVEDPVKAARVDESMARMAVAENRPMALDIKIANAEAGVKKYGQLYAGQKAVAEAEGVKPADRFTAARIHESRLAGIEAAKAVLAKVPGYVRRFDGTKGVMPTPEDIKAAFPDYKGPAQEKAAVTQSEALPEDHAKLRGAKAKDKAAEKAAPAQEAAVPKKARARPKAASRMAGDAR